MTAILELQPTGMGGEIMDMNVVASALARASASSRFSPVSDSLSPLSPESSTT